MQISLFLSIFRLESWNDKLCVIGYIHYEIGV